MTHTGDFIPRAAAAARWSIQFVAEGRSSPRSKYRETGDIEPPRELTRQRRRQEQKSR